MEDDEILLPIPVRDPETGAWDGETLELVTTTKEDYLGEILELIEEGESEDVNILEILDMLRVCSLGFADYDTAELIQLESDVSSYHQLPSGGGIFDETEPLVDGFRSIRKARDDYYLTKARRKPKP